MSPIGPGVRPIVVAGEVPPPPGQEAGRACPEKRRTAHIYSEAIVVVDEDAGLLQLILDHPQAPSGAIIHFDEPGASHLAHLINNAIARLHELSQRKQGPGPGTSQHF